MLDQHQLIADLEAEIDDLRDSAERCRKIDMAAKAALGVGLALLLVSFFWFSASALVIGIAAVLGSVALVGSKSWHARRDHHRHQIGRGAAG